MQRTFTAFLIVVAAITSARAEDGLSSPVTRPSLADIHWLVGSWRGEGLGGEYEEHWLAASGGTMLGTFRFVRAQDEQVNEFTMITEEPDRIMMRFKHYNTDYTTWEGNGRPLEFTLVSLLDRQAVFQSDVPGQRSPRRIVYDLAEDGKSLSVKVMSLDDDDQLTRSFNLEFSRDTLPE